MNGSFTILLICIKHICDIINVIPVNEKIFHSEKKKTTQTDSPLLRVIKSNALFSFSIWPHIQKSILNKNICVLFQHLRTDKKSDMYLCRRGTYSPPLSFFVLFAWYKPSARKKKKKSTRILGILSSLTSNSFVLWRSYLAALQVSFSLCLWSLSSNEAAWRGLLEYNINPETSVLTFYALTVDLHCYIHMTVSPYFPEWTTCTRTISSSIREIKSKKYKVPEFSRRLSHSLHANEEKGT